MQDFVKRMIDEHADLLVKINKLNNFIIKVKDEINKEEYTNMNIQLNAMKTYRDALEIRLDNYGITFHCGTYREKVAVLDIDGNCIFKPVEQIQVEVSIAKTDDPNVQAAKHGN